MHNKHIKNSVGDISSRSWNCVRCKQNYEHIQNDICGRNTCEVQNFKIVVDKKEKCKLRGQRNISRNFNINNITEEHKNHDRSLPHKLPHNQSVMIYHQYIRSLRNKTNELSCHLHHEQPRIF